mmetsp:Transcript_1663/g.1984  ORF Transcript_1663/g.1984 Transcript_1663/m.1984 type:complete len:414 (+) Transcript_1663:155-1396(+)
MMKKVTPKTTTAPKKPKRREPKPPNLRNLIYTRKWEECVEAVKSFPGQAALKDKLGDLPIHEACNSGAPFSVVKALHRGYPQGIGEKGFCGRLPLHYAAYNRPSLHVIQFLLRAYPEAATIFDADGRLPLHLAVVRNAPKQAIQTLIAAYPKSLTIANQFGNTPEMLARNEHVYDLLLAEKERPRGINQKLDLEKKLMRDWMDGSKSPVNLTPEKAINKTPKTIPTSQKQHHEQHLHKKTPTKSSPGLATSQARTTPLRKQQDRRYSNTHSTTRHMSPSRRTPNRITPRTSNKTVGATKATQEAGKLLVSRRNTYSSAASTSSARSQSTTRSRRTILATYDDMEHLEFTTESKTYQESRQSSPRSPIEFGTFTTHERRSRSMPRKRPVMSTQNRRKVLPSPTRVSMVVHPVWK